MNILFAILIIAVGLLALGGLIVCIYLRFKKPAEGTENQRFTQRVDRVLTRLADERGWTLVRDFSLSLPGTESVAHIDFMLMADKYCYCIVAKRMLGSVTGTPQDTFWDCYDLRGNRVSIPNPLDANIRNAASLESYVTNGDSEDGSMVLPILVVPDALSVDPELLTERDEKYIFRLKYLKRGITHIEDTAQVAPLNKDTEREMAERIIQSRG